MSIFAQVTAIFRDIDASVAAANAAAKAYADGVGKPEYYNKFGADKPEEVAMNLAGLYAADTAANVIAAMRRGLVAGVVPANDYLEALEDIYNNNLDGIESFVANNCANVAWRAGQPFRGITTTPLARIKRDVNMQFNELPVNEQDKDYIQLQAGAKFILSKLGVEVPA